MIFIDCGNINFTKLKKIEDLLIENNLNDKVIINYLKSYKSKNIIIKKVLNSKKYVKYIKKSDMAFICDTNNIQDIMKYANKVFIISDFCSVNSSKFKNISISSIPKTIKSFKKIKNKKLKKQNDKKIFKQILKILMIIMLIVLILFLIFLCVNMVKNNKKIEKKYYKNQTQEKTKELDYRLENYVLTGDSITNYYDTEKFFDHYSVVNTGKSGYKVDDLYDELYDMIYKYNPTKVVLLIGINDLADTEDNKNKDNKYIVNKILDIILDIRKKRPNCKIYLQSIYPVNDSDDDKIDHKMVNKRDNNRVREINSELEIICLSGNCKYIDMYSELSDDDGNLKMEYTTEGLHISDEGYKIITRKIKKILENE